MHKAIALLSGGIDSPVSIYKLKDKLDITAVHFHQLPLTDEQEIEKVKKLTTNLGIKKCYLIPAAEMFKALVEHCDHRHYYILSKVAMFQVAEMIAEREGAEYLITGENLAQVSSQTIHNLKAISQQLAIPILRPLLTDEKLEIINLAKEIGTYKISEGPEICALLGPKNPRTRSDEEVVRKELKRLNLSELQNAAVSLAEKFTL